MDAILTQSRPEVPAFAPDHMAEANHRIANNLSLLVSMVRMQAVAVKKKADAFSNVEVRQLLDAIAARIDTLGQLHRILAHSDSGGVISLKPHLHDITDTLVKALSSPEQRMCVVHAGADCLVLMRHVQPIVLILCEIFINALKYAHPARVPLIMTVDCQPAADGRLVLTISDDGVGLPDGLQPEQISGMGFRVMRSLAAEVGGELQIQSTQLGLSFRLSMPAAAMAGVKTA